VIKSVPFARDIPVSVVYPSYHDGTGWSAIDNSGRNNRSVHVADDCRE
jgi:hypothetical protein